MEAQELLGSFDSTLRNYAASKLRRQGIEIIEKAGPSHDTSSPSTLHDSIISQLVTFCGYRALSRRFMNLRQS